MDEEPGEPTTREEWEQRHRRDVCAQALDSLADYVRTRGERSEGEVIGVWAVIVTTGRASMRTRWVVNRPEDPGLQRLAWLELEGEFYSGLAEAQAQVAATEDELGNEGDDDDEAGSGSGPVSD